MRGKLSMCMMCLKYRITLLIVIKNAWKYVLTYFSLRGAAPYPAGAITSPLRPPAGLLCFDIPTLKISIALHLPCRHLPMYLP